ncbi:longitudinals lacking protein, isoforms F/I/K/T-like [Monomorium pharaonis]|uniref:longitudinals lacking protein, isoforms F/I/K/T-like n=1 Tax=Monomorium pharaonis TaxID=307658 RepID=UPI00063EE0B9|nr:longitudinals lacking protein, isoforms F/I/K/T-like [Monomorium pharaonis]XP_036145669.1 longitudinals lacking protein, isoforms F/I/K/T-like [Monomorium pharaonis]
MGALLSLLRSDLKQQQQPPQQSSTKKGCRGASAPTMMTRANIAMANRRASNSNFPGGNDNYDDSSGGGGDNSSGRTARSAREVVFPDSFEVLPQPHDLSVVLMSGVSHEQQRKFRCRFCGKGYRWKSTMRRHEMVECGGKPPAFQCPECPYKARQRGNLTVHFKRHHQKMGYDEGSSA